MKSLKLLFHDFNLPYLIKDTDYPVGGAAVELYAWIKGLRENNCNIGVLTWKGAKEYVGKSLDFDFVETWSSYDRSLSFKSFFKKYLILVDAVRSYNPDFIIQECAGSATGCLAYIAKKLKIPFVYRVANDMEVDDRLKMQSNKIRQIMYKYGLKSASAILCQNTYQYEKLEAKLPKKNIFIIHNPYYSNRVSTRTKNNKNRKYIAWVGVFQYQKNLPALLRIVKKSSDFNFLIAGKSAKKADEETENALVKLRSCANVKFIGYLSRDEIIPFLSNAYALLNTSRYEGFSNTFLEAFAAGTPIITLGENPDFILTKYNLGFVTNADKICSVFNKLKNSFDYIKYGNETKRYLKSHHDCRAIASNLMNILESIYSSL